MGVRRERIDIRDIDWGWIRGVEVYRDDRSNSLYFPAGSAAFLARGYGEERAWAEMEARGKAPLTGWGVMAERDSLIIDGAPVVVWACPGDSLTWRPSEGP